MNENEIKHKCICGKSNTHSCNYELQECKNIIRIDNYKGTIHQATPPLKAYDMISFNELDIKPSNNSYTNIPE